MVKGLQLREKFWVVDYHCFPNEIHTLNVSQKLLINTHSIFPQYFYLFDQVPNV